MSTQEFQRARTEEQRAQRRDIIIAAVRHLLDRKRSADVTLGDIAQEAGVAKSAILRYFGSREGLLLHVLAIDYHAWIKECCRALPDCSTEQDVAEVIATSALRYPHLCDLLGEVGSVLEHNVTPEQVGVFKTAVADDIDLLMESMSVLISGRERVAMRETISMIHAVIAHTWTLGHPSPSLAQAAEGNPRIFIVTEPLQHFCARQIVRLLKGLAAES